MERNALRNGIAKISAALIAALLVLVLVVSTALSAYAYDEIKLSKEEPKITAKAAIVYSDDLGKVVYAKNENSRQNPYSITKLMTAYVVLQHMELDHKVKIHNISADIEESQMKLKEGEVLTVEQLLQGLIVESGNDAARALAKEVAGSEAKFAEMMTAQAVEWGCKGTHFANASGMQDPKHYTTAADYLIIGRKVFENDTLREIASSKKVEIPATSKSKKRIYKNHTTLVNNKASGVIGGKTGFWNEKDCSVVLQYYKKDMRLTVVILGDTEKGREKDVATLTAAAHDMVPGYIVAKPKTEAGKLWIKGGEFTHIPVYVNERAYAYPADGSEDAIKVEAIAKKNVKAPLKKDQCVGKYNVYVDGELRATHKLYVRKAVKAGWFTSNLYISNRAAIGIAAGAVLLTLAIVLLIRRRKQAALLREAEVEADAAKDLIEAESGSASEEQSI